MDEYPHAVFAKFEMRSTANKNHLHFILELFSGTVKAIQNSFKKIFIFMEDLTHSKCNSIL